MLELLGWDSLEKQRDQLTVMMLFKLINNLVGIPHPPFPLPELLLINSSTRTQEPIHINFSFFHKQSCRLRDFLPPHVIQSDTFDSFKHLLTNNYLSHHVSYTL